MKKIALFLVIGLSAYIGAYAIAYICRGPAANLAYFTFTDSDEYEPAVYRFFYPSYFIHFRALGGDKHYLDPHVLYPKTELPDGPTELKTTEPNQRLQTTRFKLPMNSIAQGPRV